MKFKITDKKGQQYVATKNSSTIKDSDEVVNVVSETQQVLSEDELKALRELLEVAPELIKLVGKKEEPEKEKVPEEPKVEIPQSELVTIEEEPDVEDSLVADDFEKLEEIKKPNVTARDSFGKNEINKTIIADSATEDVANSFITYYGGK